MFLPNNPSYHSKEKHVDVKYHFVKEMIEKVKVLLKKVETINIIS